MATEIRMDTGGSVWKLLVKQGDAVEEGQTLFIMEVILSLWEKSMEGLHC